MSADALDLMNLDLKLRSDPNSKELIEQRKELVIKHGKSFDTYLALSKLKTDITEEYPYWNHGVARRLSDLV